MGAVSQWDGLTSHTPITQDLVPTSRVGLFPSWTDRVPARRRASQRVRGTAGPLLRGVRPLREASAAWGGGFIPRLEGPAPGFSLEILFFRVCRQSILYNKGHPTSWSDAFHKEHFPKPSREGFEAISVLFNLKINLFKNFQGLHLTNTPVSPGQPSRAGTEGMGSCTSGCLSPGPAPTLRCEHLPGAWRVCVRKWESGDPPGAGKARSVPRGSE